MSIFVVGSLVSGLSFGGMLSLGQELGSMKDQNAFEHYAALPISKGAFIAAVATRGMICSLPSAVIILLVGHYAFGSVLDPATFGILVVSGYALSGFGGIIGFASPTSQISSLITQVFQTVILSFGPVYITLSNLPRALNWFARLWPTTYAAEALRVTVRGGPETAAITPTLVLIGYTVVSFLVVPRLLSWRRS